MVRALQSTRQNNTREDDKKERERLCYGTDNSIESVRNEQSTSESNMSEAHALAIRYGSTVRIVTELYKGNSGYSPITGAKVEAKIFKGNEETSIIVELLDSGTGTLKIIIKINVNVMHSLFLNILKYIDD